MYRGNECQKDCQYKMSLSGNSFSMYCNYIGITGHSRGCDPKDRTYWQDELVERKKNNIHFGGAIDGWRMFE